MTRSRTPWLALALALAPLYPAGAAEQQGPSGKLPGSVPAIAGPSASLTPRLGVPQTGLSVPQLPANSVAFPQGITPTAAPAMVAGAHYVSAPASAQAGAQVVASHAVGPIAPVKTSVSLPGAAGTTGAPAASAQAGGDSTQQILQQLAPENVSRLSGEGASTLAAKLIDPKGAGGVLSSGGPVLGGEGSGTASLAPWQRHGVGGGDNLHDEPGIKFTGDRKPTWEERKHYGNLYWKNIWFYVYTNIVNKFGQFQGEWNRLKASGQTPPVSRPRWFFAHMRVMGQTGEFYVPGFTPRDDFAVISEAHQTFNKYFDGPGVGQKEREAFDSFLQRTLSYNASRRAASKFRAYVRDAMLKAAVMPADKIAAYFDSMPVGAKAGATTEFQAGAADAILERFRQVVLEEVAKEPAGAKGRVNGVILIGSFALGAATPRSDLDVEPLTVDGKSDRVHEFAKRVIDRWTAENRQATNPVSFHYFGYLNSRWEVRAIHHEPYLIISPEPAVVAEMAMRPGEPPMRVPSRELTIKGRFLRWLQFAAVMTTSFFTKAK